MLTKRMLHQLEQYINENYYSLDEDLSDGILYCKVPPNKIIAEIGNYLEHETDTFAERLARLMDEKDFWILYVATSMTTQLLDPKNKRIVFWRDSPKF